MKMSHLRGQSSWLALSDFPSLHFLGIPISHTFYSSLLVLLVSRLMKLFASTSYAKSWT